LRISIKTLGCKVNQAESASIAGTLREKGYEIVDSYDNPDLCIVNTCTVTAKSDYQSRQFIRRAVKSGAKVIATGCYAQLRHDELSNIQGLNLILGNSEKHRLHEYIDNLPINNVIVDSPEVSMHSGPYYSNRTRAFLKMQDGCNLSCTYCTVPMARGKSRSLILSDVLKTADRFCTEGYKEIVLTGIHIGCYGSELQPKSSLFEVVKKISASHPEIRIRLSSIEPQEFKKEFLVLINDGVLCPHLHIPLQSGSDKILKAMNRPYNTSFFKELINTIIQTCPHISIGTDIIAGFPDETEEDFNDTVRFLKEIPLSYIHVFPYSKRPDTKAASFKPQISNAEKKARVRHIFKISNIKKKAYKTSQLGQKLDVIVERKDATNGFYSAISGNYIRLKVRSENLAFGTRLRVRALSFSNGELICVPE
jgi:threonylcarbamoyladenosine tRNA methylthiotransferase MtaB